MTRAGRAFRPNLRAVSSLEGRWRIASQRFRESSIPIATNLDLDAISRERPDVQPIVSGLLWVVLELTLMLPRSMLERMVLRLIERLDDLDGDSDLEPTDDREEDLEI